MFALSYRVASSFTVALECFSGASCFRPIARKLYPFDVKDDVNQQWLFSGLAQGLPQFMPWSLAVMTAVERVRIESGETVI